MNAELRPMCEWTLEAMWLELLRNVPSGELLTVSYPVKILTEVAYSDHRLVLSRRAVSAYLEDMEARRWIARHAMTLDRIYLDPRRLPDLKDAVDKILADKHPAQTEKIEEPQPRKLDSLSQEDWERLVTLVTRRMLRQSFRMALDGCLPLKLAREIVGRVLEKCEVDWSPRTIGRVMARLLRAAVCRISKVKKEVFVTFYNLPSTLLPEERPKGWWRHEPRDGPLVSFDKIPASGGPTLPAWHPFGSLWSETMDPILEARAAAEKAAAKVSAPELAPTSKQRRPAPSIPYNDPRRPRLSRNLKSK